jgi:hypothetical protein
MQTASVKEAKPALNWRQRKKLVAARGEAMASRQQLVDSYVQALGGNVGPIVMADVERAADLVLLARDMRASVRQGSAKVSDLTRLEGAADRAVRRLNLPAPGSAAPGDDAWRKFLASQHGDG